ncbi:MAG: fucose isomerase [Clostridia bacterium]|nr:fucose isomerase [Clostridia bacterium]
MSRYRATIGVCCLGRYTYDVAAALEIYERAKADLASIDDVDWVVIDEPVIEKADAAAAAERFRAAGVDGAAIISGTFHLGHLAPTIERAVGKPVLLWAFRELPYNGGKIRLNSVCGMNLNASNLYKSGCADYCTCVSDVIDRDWVDAIRMKSAIEGAHVGLAGFRADGFFNLSTDELAMFRRTGVLLDHYELSELFPAPEDDPSGFKSDLLGTFDVSGITGAQLDKVAALCAGTRRFLDEKKLDALAIRCWPEFARDYGVAPCAMMSLLQSDGRVLACEGDVEGALSMLAAKACGVEAPFLADLSQVDFGDDFALLWHCGVAPSCLADGKSICSLDTYFAGGKGVTAGFVMKDGDFDLIRIDTALGRTRVFLARGTAVPMEKQLTGTYAKVRFNGCSVKELLDTVLDNGVAHHVAMCYGSHMPAFLKFARVMGWEVVRCGG